MKKFSLRTAAAAVLVSMAVFFLTACGGTDVTGTYSLYSVTEDGTETTLDSEEAKEAGITADFCKLELKSGDAATLTLFGVASEVTYKVDGTKLTLSVPDADSIEGTIEGNKITLESDGTKLVLQK